MITRELTDSGIMNTKTLHVLYTASWSQTEEVKGMVIGEIPAM